MLEKIKMNIEANAKLIGTVTVVIAIIVLVGVFYYLTADTNEDDTIWPDPVDPDNSGAGKFGQEIILKYADGTFQSVKPIVDGLTIWHEEKEVTMVNYVLKAKAEGGSGTVQIDPLDYRVVCKTYSSSNPSNIKNTYTLGSGGSVKTIDVDASWHRIVEWDAEATKLIPSSLNDGIWYVYFDTDGSVSYKIGTGEWKSGTIPTGIHVGFIKQASGGQIVIVFSGEADPY